MSRPHSRFTIRRRLAVAGVALLAVAGVVRVSGPASAAATFPLPSGCLIQTSTGHYVTAVDGGGRTSDVIHTDAVEPRAWEAFKVVDAGSGLVGIQTMTGNYVTAVGGGGRTTDVIHTNARVLQDWEKFTLVPVAGQAPDVFAIRTFDGHYLTAVGGGGRSSDVIHTDATQVQGWEQFRLTCNGLDPDGTMTFAPTGQGAGAPRPTIRCGLGTTVPAVRSIRGLLEVTSIGETVCKFKDTDTPAPVLLLDMSHTLYYFGTQVDNDRQVTLGLNNVATEPSTICIAGLYSIFASTVIVLPPGYPPIGVIFTPDPLTTNIDPRECLTMPDYNGLAENQARSAIQRMGLTVGTVTRQVDNTVPDGSVIAQSPPVGSPIVPGTTVVNLVVASNTRVPNLVGMDERLARLTVRAVGLVVGSVSRNNYDDVPAGIVATQNPAPGSVVAPGSAVHIAISLGPG